MQRGISKKRGSGCYQRKIKKVTDWYNHLQKERENEVINPNNKCPVKRRELKELDYYLGKIKKPKD